MWSRWSVVAKRIAVALLLMAATGAATLAATRPHYGGTLRVEMRQAPPSPEAFGVPKGFVLTSWEAGRRAVFTADDNAPQGRPFLDAVEIQMARSLRDQSADLELGIADVVELGPNELRRQVAAFAASGRPVLAECGGLLYLARELDGHEMCGGGQNRLVDLILSRLVSAWQRGMGLDETKKALFQSEKSPRSLHRSLEGAPFLEGILALQ